jgi:DNA-binding transcriptional ArsR family regulator
MNKNIFKALNDDTRREILQLLKNGSMTAGDISSHFNMTFATVSHHLSVLKEADLISDTKDGKFVIYELNTTVLDDFITFIYGLRKNKDDDK